MGKLRFRPRTLAVAVVAPALALTPAVPAAPAAQPVARAKVADKARNALRVGGIAVSRKPRPGRLLPLSRSGRFPASTLTSILSSSLLQRPLTSACPAGKFIRSVSREGEVGCAAAADITGVTAGPGLRGGGTSGDVELSLAPPLRFELSAVPALIDLDNIGTGPAIQGISRSSLATAYFRNLGTDEGQAIKAETSSNSLGDAILAYARGATGFGVHAETIDPLNPDAALYARSYGAGQAVRAEAEGTGDALRATASDDPASRAGVFAGNVRIEGDLEVTGTVTEPPGLLRAGASRLLQSPDVTNVADGLVRTDGHGYATVRLPRRFHAPSQRFRYQLTTIHSFARAVVWREVRHNRFVIRTARPGVRVSWQVTGR